MELFSSSDKWTVHEYARDLNKKAVQSNDDSAVCWCLVGGLIKCYGDCGEGTPFQRAQNKIRQAISRLFPGKSENIASFNDHVATSFEDIKKVIEAAQV